jgi:predicted nucleic acid-binding protein
MNFLCDTNIISEVMKRSPNLQVKDWLKTQELIYLSVITIEEIYFGLTYKDAKRQSEWFEKFVQLRCEVLPITFSIANRCGKLRGEFRRKGIARAQADILIAATAHEHGLILVTRNVKDFEDCNIQLYDPFSNQDNL